MGPFSRLPKNRREVFFARHIFDGIKFWATSDFRTKKVPPFKFSVVAISAPRQGQTGTKFTKKSKACKTYRGCTVVCRAASHFPAYTWANVRPLIMTSCMGRKGTNETGGGDGGDDDSSPALKSPPPALSLANLLPPLSAAAGPDVCLKKRALFYLRRSRRVLER